MILCLYAGLDDIKKSRYTKEVIPNVNNLMIKHYMCQISDFLKDQIFY